MAEVKTKTDRRRTRRVRVVDGTTYYSCGICGMDLRIDLFYLRANGLPYSYCKACDKARAMISGKQARKLRRQAVDYKMREAERAAADHDRWVRSIFAEALMLLLAHAPWAALTAEIEDYLEARGRWQP